MGHRQLIQKQGYYPDQCVFLLFDPTLDNYIKTFTRPPQSVWRAYLNSLVISGTVTILVMLMAGMAAFAMVRYRFRGRRLLDSLIVASLMFPVFSTIIPVFQMLSAIRVVDNPIGVILPQTAGNLAFAIVILMGYIRGLPVDMEESAFLEGCNVFQVFYRIVVPVCRGSPLPQWRSLRFCGRITICLRSCSFAQPTDLGDHPLP